MQHAIQLALTGNHSMDMGSSGRTSLCVNATHDPKDLPLGCSMHMANHSCNPNCRVTPYEPEGWNNDLVLLMLVAMSDIVSGEAVTFQYKGSMWH
jgi:SET domain-containing protein